MKRILLFATLLPLICACTKSEPQDPEPEAPQTSIIFKAAINEGTKATDYGFEYGDNISVVAVKKAASNTIGTISPYGGNYAENTKFTYNDGYFVSTESPIYYPDDNMPLFFTAIYPYRSSISPNFTFKVNTDQTGSGYTNSDLMTATTPATTEKTPELQFYHRLSSIIVNVHYNKAPSGKVEALFTNVTVSAEIDLNKRYFSASGSAKTSVTPASNGTNSYKVILPPQTIKAKTALLTLYINGSQLTWAIEDDIVLRSGSQLTFDLTVNTKNEITFTSLINPWNSSEQIEDIIEPELLDNIEKYIPIHRGNNPPVVNGTYFINPTVTVFCEDQGNGGYDPGKIVESEYIRLSNQNNKTLTIDYEEISASLTSHLEGKGSFICGDGNYFSIYFDTEGSSDGISFRTALVISGEKTSGGIKDLYYAFVMVEKGSDPTHELMEEGVFRVFKDQDGISVNSTWPSGTKAILPLADKEIKKSVYRFIKPIR